MMDQAHQGSRLGFRRRRLPHTGGNFMVCRDAGHCTEIDFVASLRERDHDCRGPLLEIALPEPHFIGIGDSLAVSDRLWAAAATATDDTVTFSLCAAHWMDLSYFTGVSGVVNGRPDWSLIANDLLCAILRAAGWDFKEMSNLLAWRRAQLT